MSGRKGRPKLFVDLDRDVLAMRAAGFTSLGIARVIGCSVQSVTKAIARMRADGVVVPPPVAVKRPLPPRRRRNDRTEGPPQPTMASLAQFMAAEAYRQGLARLKPGAVYRDILPDGRLAAWVSVVPSREDGLPLDAKAQRPDLFSSSGSPAAMCAGL